MCFVVQMIMSTLVTDIGLTYGDAVEIIKSNKEQLEKYGSNMAIRDVGFYIRKQPLNMLGTGRDKIVLVTGRIRQAGEGKNVVMATMRYPWDNNAKSNNLFTLKQHWKLCKDEKAAKNLWNHWHRYVHQACICIPGPLRVIHLCLHILCYEVLGFDLVVVCRYTEKKCWHAQPCAAHKKHGYCPFQTRLQRVKVLHGSLLHAWDRILHTNCQGMFKEEEDECVSSTTPVHTVLAC